MRVTRSLIVAALFFVSPAIGAEPELGPPPRLVESHVRFEKIIGGYQIILTRKASEKLVDALIVVGDGEPYTNLARLAAKELHDPDAEKKIDFLSLIVKTQAPAMKKSLEEKMGPGGAIIKVFGVENKNIPAPPPLAMAIGEAFMPPDIRDKVQTGIRVVRTTPLLWRVEGRK